MTVSIPNSQRAGPTTLNRTASALTVSRGAIRKDGDPEVSASFEFHGQIHIEDEVLVPKELPRFFLSPSRIRSKHPRAHALAHRRVAAHRFNVWSE